MRHVNSKSQNNWPLMIYEFSHTGMHTLDKGWGEQAKSINDAIDFTVQSSLHCKIL